jgi:aryl-alcohol dehydrogenase-like predicted oxidoreductase
MLYRTLGKTGLKVSALGFGGWGIGAAGWAVESDEESLKSIRLAMDHGVNFFDSALGYGGGHSEMLIGKAVKGKQDQYVVTSKIPPKNYTWPQVPGTPVQEAYPKDWIIECTEKSLKNYDLDYIDLQQCHVWLNEWTDSDEWKEAVELLKKQGKIRFFGASINFPYTVEDDAVPSMEMGCLDSVQVVHNIFQQEPEQDVFVTALKNNVGIIARCPLDEGALSGKITPESKFAEGSFLEGYFKDDRKQIVYDKTQAMNWLMAEGFADNLAEAAIRYCISFPAVSSIVVGMRSPKHTDANCAAIDKGPLPEEAVKRLKAHAWDHNYWI